MVLRVGVFVWASDHASTISEVVKDIIINTPFSVLIVDDGSESLVDDSLYSFEVKQGIESGRVWVIRHAKKRGLGVALTRAAEELCRRGYTHLLSLKGSQKDSSAQILSLARSAKDYPFDLIVHHGSRLRLYPLFHLQNISLFMRGCLCEAEAQLRLYWSGHTVRELDGKVFKAPTAFWSRSPKANSPRLKNGINFVVRWVVSRLGLRRSYRLAGWWVPLALLFWSSARRALVQYNILIRPGSTWIESMKQSGRSLFSFAVQNIDQHFQQLHEGAQFKLRGYGIKDLQSLMQSSNGVILLQSRAGNFELAADLAGLPKSSSTIKVRADRPEGGPFELVPFLGRLVAIDTQPYDLAVESQKPMMMVFSFKNAQQGYDFYAMSAKTYPHLPEDQKELERLEWASDYVDMLEGFLKSYPEQWFNFFPIWSCIHSPNALMQSHLIEELEMAMSVAQNKSPQL